MCVPGIGERTKENAGEAKFLVITSVAWAVLGAARLARLFGMDARTWMNLQAQYHLEVAERELHDRIEQEVTPLAA